MYLEPVESSGAEASVNTARRGRRLRAGFVYYGAITAWYASLAAIMILVGILPPYVAVIVAAVLLFAAGEVVVVVSGEGVEDWWDNFRAENRLLILGTLGNLAAIGAGALLGEHLR